MKAKAISYALLSAALFGVSTPAAKLLLADMDQRILAGLLYCGAGVGVALLRRLPLRLGLAIRAEEATLGGSDWAWMGAATLAGGVAGPLLLMFGLAHAEAATASLLLTLEGVFTAAIAWFVLREPFDRRIALGMALIVAGSLCLAWSGAPSLSGALGPVAIAAACLAWAVDNNLTRRVSLSDPLQIVEIKVAGAVNLGIGLFAGASLPSIPLIGAASVVGFLGYGLSLALFVLALRHLGAARTGAYFSTAPFLGAAVSVAALGDPLTMELAAGAALMGAGVWLHLTESHEHEHLHQAVEHSHSHVHDEHHRHGDHSDHENGQPHIHRHTHEPLLHEHPHMPDTHHRHDH